MPSVIQKKSYGSVKIFWLNKELLDTKLKQSAIKMMDERKEVESVYLFGSFAENKGTVSSDVDILLILKSSDKRFIDRYLDYIDYFSEIELNVDLLVYTRAEIDTEIPFVKKVLDRGIKLC